MNFKQHVPSLILVFALIFSFALVAIADTVTTEVVVGNATPAVSSVALNASSAITLTENTTTAISATATVTDANGCASLSTVVGHFYRSGVTAGGCDLNSEDDDQSCYAEVACTVTGASCTGGPDTSATYTCDISMEYYADPTVSGAFSAQDWEVTITATDDEAAAHSAVDNVELNSLMSLDVTSAIDYGTLAANSDTGATNETTTATNTGNVAMDPEISGTVLTSGGDTIAIANQEYSATAFTWSAGTDLSGTPAGLDLVLAQPTEGTAPVTDAVEWGLGVDNGQATGSYTGTNTFTAATAI